MTEIKDQHVEWAVVDRLRCMLASPPPSDFNVTQTYAYFTSILCWTLQHIREDPRAGRAGNLRKLKDSLSKIPIESSPWDVSLSERCIEVGAAYVCVPRPQNFDDQNAFCFLVHLRNASAHGDSRKIRPFHIPHGSNRVLCGFVFRCDEKKKKGKPKWSGEITLLEGDMRRIGGAIADLYCNTLSSSDTSFAADANEQVWEVAK
jgi:hypothetical protein